MGTRSPTAGIPAGCCVVEGSVDIPGVRTYRCCLKTHPSHGSVPAVASWEKGNRSPATLRASPGPAGGGPWVSGGAEPGSP